MSHRICHVSTVHPTYDSRIFHKECVSLANAGYETHLVVQGGEGEHDGVFLHGLRKPINRVDRMTRLVGEALEVALDIDAEIYHLHDPELLRIAGRLVREGKHVIFDSHEFYRYQIGEKEYLPKPVAKVVSAIYSRYEASICAKIDAVIVPCTRLGEDPFQDIARRTVLVDNFPILPKDGISPEFERERRDAVCYVGGLTRSRGITQFVKAGYRAGVRVILAGPITDEYRAELEAMPEYECVEYEGVLDRQGVAGVIAESFCGTAALLNVGQYWLGDNLPTKAYEYMAGGIPFIMSPTPYARRLVKEWPCCVLTDPEDIDAYGEAIRRLRDDSHVAESMAKVGYEALIEHFNWGNEARGLVGLYEELTTA